MSIILPIEGLSEQEFALDTAWYDKIKPNGISFLLRAKNEGSTIRMALESIADLAIPYEINVFLNLCDDNTNEIVMNSLNRGRPIRIYKYPHVLGKTGVENLCTPVNSVHSTIWYLNWALMKSNFSYTFRYDADFIMTHTLRKKLENIFISDTKSLLYRIPAIFSVSGHVNSEIYLFANESRPRFYKYILWHAMDFGKDINIDTHSTPLECGVIHDSDFKHMKEYWNHKPWWETDARPEMEQMRQQVINEYNVVKKSLGEQYTLFARASCQQTDQTARKITSLFGIKQEEIAQLCE